MGVCVSIKAGVSGMTFNTNSHEDEGNDDAQFDSTAFQDSCTLFPHLASNCRQQDPHAPPHLSPKSITTTPRANATALIPSIQLITAPPSAAGLSALKSSSSSASASFARALRESWDVVAPTPAPLLVLVHVHSPSLIAPRTAAAAALGDTHSSTVMARRKLHPQHEDGAPLHVLYRKFEERTKNLSHIVLRVGLSESALIHDTSCTYAYATGGQGDFESYVDPSHVDPDISEIALVKQKSRVVLDVV
ncbi:LOW QUALITY PROTEIN: hypothetical protein CVT25_006116 [Psilocybe cyanescens]|uniref:Uncharacterized protein n=1 Tax=Psilocybe cyanescens TaxID=93625 RepID=A0A409X791_PSICY|nr:LOW QUALITY PROTEIN: hypothetical protein CVT25_006116 [Psilocybe cyanescens]